jgi:uncharacterized protein (TIGR03083 family)
MTPGYGGAMAKPGDYVAAVNDTLTAVADVCRDLDEAAWSSPTGCPGWSVKDNVSHICDVEHLLVGDPPTAIEMAFGDHVVSPVGERMELGVELRRSWTPSEVLADLEATTKRRIEHIAGFDEAALEEIAYGHPFGPMPQRNFLTLRVFDLFTHEQDIRRAVDRPGKVESPAAQMTVRFAVKSLARFLSERAPEMRGRVICIDVDGFTTTVDLTGERPVVRHEPGPGVRMSFDLGNFMAWIGGRSDRADFAVSGAAPPNDLTVVATAFRTHAGMTP